MLVTSLKFNSLGKRTMKCVAIAGVALMTYGTTLTSAMAQSSVQQLQHQIKQLRGEIADLQKVVYKGAQPPNHFSQPGECRDWRSTGDCSASGPDPASGSSAP